MSEVSDPRSLTDLIVRFLDGEAAPDEQSALAGAVQSSPQARALFARIAHLHGNLPSALQEIEAGPDRATAAPLTGLRARAWRPLAALALATAAAASVAIVLLRRPERTAAPTPSVHPAPTLASQEPPRDDSGLPPPIAPLRVIARFDLGANGRPAAPWRRGIVVRCPPGAPTTRCLSGQRAFPNYANELLVAATDWDNGLFPYGEDSVLTFRSWVGQTTSARRPRIRLLVWDQARKGTYETAVLSGRGAEWTRVEIPLRGLRPNERTRGPLAPGDVIASMQIILEWNENDLFVIDDVTVLGRP